MKLILLFTAPPALLALCFALGVANPTKPEDPLSVRHGNGGQSTTTAVRPGESSVAALSFLKTLRYDPPPLPPPPSPPPPPPPPPQDVTTTFRDVFRGVQRNPTTQETSVLIATAPGSISHIREGQIFSNGWTISTITTETVILTKGRETRQIRVFG